MLEQHLTRASLLFVQLSSFLLRIVKLKYVMISVLSLFSLAGCSVNPTTEIVAASEVSTDVATSDTQESGEKPVDEPPRHQKVYFFQHKLIPQWLFESDDAFYFDLSNGYFSGIYQIAEEYIDTAFSDALEIRYFPDEDAVLFIFQEPNSPPNCFFALIAKDEGSYRYITYESTMPLNDGVVGVVGGWNVRGDHLNYGARAYRTSSEFVEDVLNKNTSKN